MLFFRFRAPNSDLFSGLTQAYFEANSGDFPKLTQNFDNFKQNYIVVRISSTLWCQLEDTFQLIVTPQGMELVMVHIEVISQCLKKYRVEYKACYIFLLDTIQL